MDTHKQNSSKPVGATYCGYTVRAQLSASSTHWPIMSLVTEFFHQTPALLPKHRWSNAKSRRESSTQRYQISKPQSSLLIVDMCNLPLRKTRVLAVPQIRESCSGSRHLWSNLNSSIFNGCGQTSQVFKAIDHLQLHITKSECRLLSVSER